MKSVRLGLALLLTTAAVVLVQPSPALAADPGLTISVVAQQEGNEVTSTQVGTEVTLVATLSEPARDVGVIFSSDAGWRSGVEMTDGDGQVSFPYTSALAETETVTAALVTAGCEGTVSPPLQHQWWVPELVLELGTSSYIGDDTTVTARLRHDGETLTDAEVEVTVRGEDGTFLDGLDTTSAAGVTTATWSRAESTVDTVIATQTGAASPVRRAASVIWIPAPIDVGRLPAPNQPPSPDLDLVQDPTSSRAGTDHQFQINLDLDALAPEPDDSVYFLQLYGGGDPVGDRITVSRDQTTYSAAPWSPPGPEVTSVTAVLFQDAGSDNPIPVQLDSAAHEWWLPELSLNPGPSARAVTGTTAGAQATLSHAGEPVAGEQIVLSATPRTGGGTTETSTSTTDGQGRATLSWSRGDEGVDDVSASWSSGGSTVEADTFSWRWLDQLARYVIELDQDGTDGRLGTTAALTAEVTRFDGEDYLPAEGVGVRFAGSDLPSPLVKTDDTGTATFSLPAQQPGAQQLRASIVAGDCTLQTSDPVEHEWWLPDLTLVPVIATSRVNEPAAVTARLMHGSAALDGVPLEFTRRNGSGTLLDTFTTTTEPDGTALYGWTSATAGIDTVTVTEIAVPQPQSATATHGWTVDPTDPVTPDPVTPDPVTPDPVTPDPITPPPPQPITDPPTEPSVDEITPSSPSVSPTVTATESQSERPTPTPEPGAFDPPAETGQTGGELKLSGRGCPAGSTVSLALAGLALGSTTADENGAYELQVPAPDLPLGRHPLQARCGDTVIDGNLDLSSSASGNGQVAGAGATTGAVLLFFLLLGNTVLGGLRARL